MQSAKLIRDGSLKLLLWEGYWGCEGFARCYTEEQWAFEKAVAYQPLQNTVAGGCWAAAGQPTLAEARLRIQACQPLCPLIACWLWERMAASQLHTCGRRAVSVALPALHLLGGCGRVPAHCKGRADSRPAAG